MQTHGADMSAWLLCLAITAGYVAPFYAWRSRHAIVLSPGFSKWLQTTFVTFKQAPAQSPPNSCAAHSVRAGHLQRVLATPGACANRAGKENMTLFQPLRPQLGFSLLNKAPLLELLHLYSLFVILKRNKGLLSGSWAVPAASLGHATRRPIGSVRTASGADARPVLRPHPCGRAGAGQVFSAASGLPL